MEEESKKRAIQLLQEYNSEGNFEEITFKGSEELLKKFEQSFGGPIHASTDDTGFFKPTKSNNEFSVLKMYFVCMHFEDTGRDELEKLCVFIRELESALSNVAYNHIDILIESLNGNAEEFILEIYYHEQRKPINKTGDRDPIDEWADINHFCFKHCTECTDCPLKKDKKEGEPCELSRMIKQTFAIHDKMFAPIPCDCCGKERELFDVKSNNKIIHVCDSCYGLFANQEDE
jgi:hypothetical protein